MIDREARKAARAISQGGTIDTAPNSKVAVYGLLARALDPSTLEGGLKLQKKPSSFAELELALNAILRKSAHKGFFDLDRATRNDVHELLSERIPNARDSVGGLALTGLSRLIQGSGTGAHTEVMTLRTIAQKQATGEKISEKGLYASAKVPFVVAMMHLDDLLIDRENYDIWSTAEGGDNGQVFRATDVRLDYSNGLRLANVPDSLASVEQKLEHGPQIGCPVTLVKGYIQKAHEATADTALEAGLIAVS